MKSKLYILLLCIPIIASAAKVPEASKVIKETFQVSGPVNLFVDNGYGDIDVNVGSADEVTIEVEIKATGGSDKAEAFVESTDIKFIQSGNKISAVTQEGVKNKSNWFKWGSGKFSYKVNYKITIPKTTDLDIDHKHGKIYIEDISGSMDIDLGYGDLLAGDVSGTLDLDLRHGDAVIGDVGGDSEISISYGELILADINNAEIKSKNSEIEIGTVLDASIFSNYDEYEIGQAGNVYNEGSYNEFEIDRVESLVLDAEHTNYEINWIRKSVEAETNYGSIEISDSSADFNKADFTGEHTDIALVIKGGFSFNLEGKHSGFDLPRKTQYESKIKDGKNKTYIGYYDREGSCTVTGKMLYGEIKIRD